MKRYRAIFVILIVGVLLTSCEDFLNPNPTPDAAIAGVDFPANESELELVLVGAYDAVKGQNGIADTDRNLNHGIQREFYVTEMLTDNTQSANGESGEASQFDFFQVVATNGFVFDNYRSSYETIFRTNLTIESLDVATEENRPRIEAEARFLRAMTYFNLVRLYGDVPLALEVIFPENQEIQFTRVATSEIYEVIIEDFQFAIENLTNTDNRYRASIPAAQGLLAKVYLTLGIYGEAQDLLETIINSQQFSLEPNFVDVWFQEDNSETIFSIGYVPDDAFNSQDFSAEMRGGNIAASSGQNYVTDDMVVTMNLFGGERTQYSMRADPLTPSRTQVVKYLPDGDADLGIPATGTIARLGGNDWIVLRYADILLMHAESILAGQLVTSASNAIGSYQLVRDRAGLTDTTDELTRDDLLLERIEQEVLSAFSASIGGAFTATDLLLPIPQFEINISSGLLEQNPGF